MQRDGTINKVTSAGIEVSIVVGGQPDEIAIRLGLDGMSDLLRSRQMATGGRVRVTFDEDGHTPTAIAPRP